MPATPESLQLFVSSCRDLKDEKSDAQTFLNRFFQAFGYVDAIEAGAVFEKRVKKASQKGKTGFADLMWVPEKLPGLLVEMKKKGTDLSLHYPQMFQYWTLVAPKPKYAMLCNFDEFWIYDFNIQVDTPVDVVRLEQFADRAPSTFAFMESSARKPVFQNNQQEITELAGNRMGLLCQMLKARSNKAGFDELTAQRFVLQCVLAMFAEDRGLLPRDLFVGCVQECLAGASSYDVLGGLFLAMNTPGVTPAGRYAGVEYFNGGLFKRVHPIELDRKELEILEVAAKEDWSRVRPAIFGNIFEGSLNKIEQHKYGMHYTSEVDIMKIVRPTISRFWEERIEAARTIGELEQLQFELQNYRVLDPACGSGNFLYLAYLELKRIERLLLDKITSRRKSSYLKNQGTIAYVTPLQFFGMDTNEFAVELARVTLMIARKIAIDNFGILDQPALPLDSLDQNIVCTDALFTEWVKADAIVGNPPFLGGNKIRTELGDQYTEKVFERFSEVKGQVDFCCFWYRLAHENLQASGRAGLVSTQTVSEGVSRTAALNYILENGGHIYDAIPRQKWSGEAKLDISIVNWSKEIPKQCYLDNLEVKTINSSLKSSVDVTKAIRLNSNQNLCFEGVKPYAKGFTVNEEKGSQWINQDKSSLEILKRLVDGTSLTESPNGFPLRWIIDVNSIELEDLDRYPIQLEHLKNTVKEERAKEKDLKLKTYWWRFERSRPGMRTALMRTKLFFAMTRVSKWSVFLPLSTEFLPDTSINAIASQDFYVFGVLSSSLYRNWFEAQRSTLQTRTRFTPTTCFQTFPFPQTPTAKQIEAIRKTAIELHEYRSAQMEKKQWGITKLYNEYFNEPASQLAKLHKTLDDLVLKAYGFSKTDDLLEKLLSLNLEVAEKEKRGESVVGPWAPDDPPSPLGKGGHEKKE